MADVTLQVLRDITTKAILAYAYDEFGYVPSGQEQIEVTIDETDAPVFTKKYRFNSGTGELEINGKLWYALDVSDDAVAHNPVTSYPQLTKGGTNYITVSLQKKDHDGIDQTGAGNDDTIYVSAEGGDAYPADTDGTPITSVDLINGAASFRVYSSTQVGTSVFRLLAEDIDDGRFGVESV